MGGGNLYSDGNLATAETLDQEVGLLLGDRGFIGNHPAFLDLGDAAGTSASKRSKEYMGLGLGTMSEVAEGAAVGITDYDFERVSATVARRSKGRRISDFLASLDASGRVRDPAAFAFDAISVYQNTLMELFVSAGTTFTNDETPGSGVELDWATVRAAKRQLVGENNDMTPGLVALVLHPVQWGHLEEDGASADIGDAISRSQEAYNAMLARSIGWQGRYFGIDVFTSPRIPTDAGGTNRVGFMAAPGAIVWAKASIAPDPAAIEIRLQGGLLQVEFQRRAERFQKDIFFNALLGAAKGIDEAGCTITSKA